jgi:orotidine-5'-phosphate decarboxylase
MTVPTQRSFSNLVDSRRKAGRHVCIGLDIDPIRIPKHIGGDTSSRVLEFAKSIVTATHDVAGAYKPNAAFFEALGDDGPSVLREVVRHINAVGPEIPVILDAKRADIASSNDGYVSYLFEYLGADATTVHPYLGHEALRPFLDRADKGIYVLCRTSNPGAGELQDLDISGQPLFMHVASLVATTWNRHGNCGLVVGATYPSELGDIRRCVPAMPLLIPGVGVQGGDLEATVRAAHGGSNFHALINASRSVLYASSREDFAEQARSAVDLMNEQLASVLANL